MMDASLPKWACGHLVKKSNQHKGRTRKKGLHQCKKDFASYKAAKRHNKLQHPDCDLTKCKGCKENLLYCPGCSKKVTIIGRHCILCGAKLLVELNPLPSSSPSLSSSLSSSPSLLSPLSLSLFHF
jgi:hypothetical protein